MKNALIAVCLSSFIFSCSARRSVASAPVHAYEISYDRAKILKGPLQRSDIENDTSFAWFKNNMKYGTANAGAVAAFKNNAAKFTVTVFFGTWCEDSQNLVPIFYRLVDRSGYPGKNITLIGVDRAKTALKNLQLRYNIINVPTFIVMHNGKEVGRVVEYGKYGEIDKELGEIVASIP